MTVVTSRRLKKDPCLELPDDTFIVNPKGCKYFFCCKHGVSVSAYCPHGLWLNAKKRICDLPQHVDCHLDDPVVTTTTTTAKPSIHTPASSTTTKMTTTTKVPSIDGDQDEIMCPMHDADAIRFVASKINCRHYYICYHGHAVRQECSKGSHWDAKAHKCKPIADAGCNVSA